MNNMYEIYDGFKDDAPEIFKPLIDKFHFEIKKISDYEIMLVNSRCSLDFFCEVSLIVWYYNQDKYKDGILLTQYFYKKNKKQYVHLNDLYFKKFNREYFIELCEFLIENFSEELME